MTKILTFLELIFDTLFILLIKKEKTDNKSLVIIKTDAIGDYILFRNFLQKIKETPQYKEQSITLVGNVLWKSLAEKFDSNYVDQFIWINPKKFISNPLYRYKKLFKIRTCKFHTAINPLFTHDLLVSDTIVRFTSARYKIGQISNQSHRSKMSQKILSYWYTELLKANAEIQFEFFRNLDFITKIFPSASPLLRTFLPTNFSSNLSPDKKYFLICIGSSNIKRQWPKENYLKLISLIDNNYTPVLIGSSNELQQSLFIKENFKDHLLNLVGKTSLLDLIPLINNAQFIISNESSFPHIAVALDTPSFVISNGNHLGRFSPYPIELSKVYGIIFPEIIERQETKSIHFLKKFEHQSDIDINTITVQSAFEKFTIFKKEILSSKNEN
jgi:ADP-heptose:LPS heptosyltransferase